MAEQKIPCTYWFSRRQHAAIDAEAERLGITRADVLRRVIDLWIDGMLPLQIAARPAVPAKLAS